MAKTPEEKMSDRIDKLEELVESKNNEIKRVKRKAVTAAEAERVANEKLKIERAVPATALKIPKWITKPSQKKHQATPVQMYSDPHFGRIQPPAEIAYYNAYSDKIAEARLKYTANSSIRVIKEYTAGLAYPGVVLPFAGDFVENEIHNELTKSNAETVIETVVRWVPKLAAMVEQYANEFDEVFIPCAVGNHARRSVTMEHKNSARDSYDWLIYRWLAHYFKNDDQINFFIPDALEARFKIYDTRFLLTHGYFGGGGGADSYSRVVNMRKKTIARDRATGNDFDYMLMGHYHTHVVAPGIIQCGSMAGLDAYAHDISVAPEPSTQALFFVTPERGVTMSTPIHCESPTEKKTLWDKVTYYRDM